jgi:hypothetical protein
MTTLDPLRALPARLAGPYALILDPAQPAHGSRSAATVRTLAGGRFVQIDYRWSLEGKPQSGSMIVGGNAADATMHWVDSFHQSTKVMDCRGTIRKGGVVDVRGTYAAPPGPDWGWRTVLAPRRGGLHLAMYNVWPDGREDLAVDASWVTPKAVAGRRASASRTPRTRRRSRRGS